MTVRNPNAKAALALLEELCRLGVREVCISPGSRSTALVTAALKTAAMRSRVILDERSSAFFALGLARASGRPALAICTSGTAAANFMPAVVEANLSHTPLIVLTADRPPELQDCHAPQTIDQTRLYGVHVRLSIELPAPEDPPDLEENFRAAAFRAFAAAIGIPPRPGHINFPLRAPPIHADACVLGAAAHGRDTPKPARPRPGCRGAAQIHARSQPARAYYLRPWDACRPRPRKGEKKYPCARRAPRLARARRPALRDAFWSARRKPYRRRLRRVDPRAQARSRARAPSRDPVRTSADFQGDARISGAQQAACLLPGRRAVRNLARPVPPGHGRAARRSGRALHRAARATRACARARRLARTMGDRVARRAGAPKRSACRLSGTFRRKSVHGAFGPNARA